ncbi:two-component sensor histidine kinase BarA [uncultured Aliivibrio sp.]|uniref:two-component sensor histidine kinase BarA n=1 Tax=uncultured Aliivibrio sp. TaxID=873085 RepID=UPI00260EABE6|nr:two-component sensor histidine kinase BarA [uncultured Aliivibrio sp.]
MTKYGLRARVITLTLAPTLIIGLLLSGFFTMNRYNDLEDQLISSGMSIIEPLAISSEYGMTGKNREAVRRLISYAHRKHSKIVRSIAVFDEHHELFVTSNFHPNFESLTFPKDKPIPLLLNISFQGESLILRTPILPEGQFSVNFDSSHMNEPLGYIAIELDLSSLRLQQYQEIFSALIVLFLGLSLSGVFAYRLMQDVTQPISHMVSVVDRIRRGHLNVRIENTLHGELDTLKNGINAMAISLSEYHVEMQQSIDQATSDLRETLEQLEIQNVELDIAKKRAQEAARVKSEFLANMSHELRTPLNGVIGFTRQMLKTSLSNNQTDYLQTIERSANNLLTIINDILDFSKLEAGKLLLENLPFNFQDSLDEMVSLLAPSAHEKGLEITLKIDPRVPSGLIGDPLRIQQVLNNLVGNSIKFTEKGNIDISVELKHLHDDSIELQFVVRDTGIGISERQQAQLFQAFSQADASISRRYGGTGLGLVITQKLVAQMGGDIGLNSRLHQGSTFWFTIKMNSTELPMIDEIDVSQLESKRLLLIEPNMQSASILQKQLIHHGMFVTYSSTLPGTIEPHDFALISLSSTSKPTTESLQTISEKLIPYCPTVIVGLPSTELALTEELNQHSTITCLSKPFAKKKLLDALLISTQSEATPALPNLMASHVPLPQRLPIKVMAVDDNPANLKLISALLYEQVETVVTCENGIDAVQQATEQKFDIILMDIQMPKMDGVMACQEIRKTLLNAQTPIVAVTAHAMAGERERLINEGMDDYLTKPIEEHVLQQVIIHWSPLTEITDAKKINILPNIVPEPHIEKTTSNDPGSIDWGAALKQSAGKEDLAKEMLKMLVEFIPEVDGWIEKALEGNSSTEELCLHIHKLHGSSSYCGVPRLKQLCNLLETALRQDQSIEDIEPELFELQDEMKKVTKAAQRIIN